VSISAPVRVRLKYPDLDTFVERFAPNVTRGGVFIASRAPRPVGDTFPFEVQLATGAVALAGEGKVIWVKEFNPAEPTKAHGMGVQFTSLSGPSREVLQRMLKAKEALRGAIPRGYTQPLATLSRPNVDTSVDLAAEFGIEDTVLRRALDRAWLGGKPTEDELQGLMKPEASEPAVTLPLALNELRRMLDPTQRRRTTTGRLPTLESLGAAPVAPAPLVVSEAIPVAAAAANGAPTNGVHAHDD
jgi:uncharacterized protein (TIGR02266 family)